MTEDSSEAEVDDIRAEPPLTAFGYLMRRILGPAMAVVILVASIWLLPSALMNQIPSVSGTDLFFIFLAAVVAFALLAWWLDRRGARDED